MMSAQAPKSLDQARPFSSGEKGMCANTVVTPDSGLETLRPHVGGPKRCLRPITPAHPRAISPPPLRHAVTSSARSATSRSRTPLEAMTIGPE